MFARIAAVLFGVALLFQLISFTGGGNIINTGTLTTAGLLFVALHLGGISAWRPGRRYRR